MTKLVFFKEWGDPWHRTDDTGFNKTGYVTETGMVIYPRRSRIARTTIEAVKEKSHRLVDLSNHPCATQIEAVFINNVINTALYVTAMEQIGHPRARFWDNPVKIPILSPISAEEHEARWSKMLRILKKGDGIFTVDTKSIASRLITHLDQGTWSHVGQYVGNGKIVEAMTAGVVERSIEEYHHHRYRLGVYRLPDASTEQIESIIAAMRSRIGDRYSYRKVLLLGIRLALGIWPSLEQGASLLARHATPNRIITVAGYDLTEVV
jgi:hypothetical protein